MEHGAQGMEHGVGLRVQGTGVCRKVDWKMKNGMTINSQQGSIKIAFFYSNLAKIEPL
jgi:hypothetical protein